VNIYNSSATEPVTQTGAALRQRYFLRVVLVFALYVTVGKLGLSVPFTSGNVSPVWPASGVALATVLLWGYEIWPGLALAAFFVNFLSPIPAIFSVGIALGNTSSALLGGYLVRRFISDKPSFDRLRDVLGLIAFGAAIGPIVAASVGATTLLLAHIPAWSGFGSAWRIWWLGDAMGVLIVTPLFFTGRALTRSFNRARMIESFVLLLSLLAMCFAIFGGRLGLGMKDDVLAFLAFPFVIWAAIRFRAFGAAIATFVIAAMSVWGTALGNGPFIKHNPLHDAALLQLFIAVTAVTGLVLGAVTTEREEAGQASDTKEKLLRALHQAQSSLQEAHAQLDLRVRERTAELERARESLRALSGQLLTMQDEERRRIARELHDSAGQITVALGMNLTSILAETKNLTPKAGKACREASELVQQLSRELRTISHLLHPPLLDEAGLPPALTWLVDGFAQRSKISVKLDLAPDLGRFSPEVETAIFRVIQECLTNVLRHSESRAASIRIARDADEIKVEVRDQGKGMPSGSNGSSGRRRMGVGIQGMRERITQLGGRFDIRSAKNGTTVVASIPVPSAAIQTVRTTAQEAS
jgi:signal transduction histidine kinase